jgi:hypothetical protein
MVVTIIVVVTVAAIVITIATLVMVIMLLLHHGCGQTMIGTAMSPSARSLKPQTLESMVSCKGRL